MELWRRVGCSVDLTLLLPLLLAGDGGDALKRANKSVKKNLKKTCAHLLVLVLPFAKMLLTLLLQV